MERIFTYIAALLSRLLFSTHIILTVWWLTLVQNNTDLWYIIIIYACCSLLETAITVFYRKGHEYYWFCPSIFIYTAFAIPCFVILRMKLGECWRQDPESNEESIRCSTNVSRPSIERQVENFGLKALLADDERIISVLDQTFLLLLVIGRWLLPKGQMSRDQLSQLLFIYIAAAADIVELTEIYDTREVLSNESMTNLVISVWSISLLQFSVTIQNSETIAQVRDIEEQKLEKQKDIEKNDGEIRNRIKSNKIAPALYTYKLAHRKAMARQRERLSTMSLHSGGIEKPTHKKTNEKPSKTSLSKMLARLKNFENIVQSFIHKHIDLIQLVTPMLFQDGPFLMLRIFVASKYSVVESNMFLFLIAKNAIVVLLQVYRICVLYCTKRDTISESDEDIFEEHGATKLRNVQTAKPSIRTATVTFQAAAKFRGTQSRKRKKSRSISLVLKNPLTAMKKRRKDSKTSAGQNSNTEEVNNIEQDSIAS